MIKQLLHKITSFGLALLVLFSTMSFTVEKHFCCGELVDIAVFSEPQKCGMGAFETEKITLKDHCCSNIVEVIKGQDDIIVGAPNDLEFHQQIFLTSFIFSFVDLFNEDEKKEVLYINYSPPSLVKDIQVLDQVFII